MEDKLLGSGYTKGEAKQRAIKKLLGKPEKLAEKHADEEKRKEWEERADLLQKLKKEELELGSSELDARYDANKSHFDPSAPSIGRLALERWSHEIIVCGRRLDTQLDVLLSEVIALKFDWNSSRSRIADKLQSVLVRREDLRAFEIEVEEFLESVSDRAEPNLDVLPITKLMNQLQRTYDRVYDLCVLKLTTISQTRATYASILVAIVAVLIALAQANWGG